MHEQLHHWKELFKHSTMALTTLPGDLCSGSYAHSKFWTSMPGCTIGVSLQNTILDTLMFADDIVSLSSSADEETFENTRNFLSAVALILKKQVSWYLDK